MHESIFSNVLPGMNQPAMLGTFTGSSSVWLCNLQKDELQSVSLKYYQQVEEPQLRREVSVCLGIDLFWSFHISMGILYRLLIK